MYTKSNDLLSISVNSIGAELSSITYRGKEYLWNADDKYWNRHSPILFPIVGGLWNGTFRSKERIFKLSRHGFARDMPFRLKSEKNDEIIMELASSDETIIKYPYSFILEIGYKIEGNKVRVSWRISNPSEETIHFQIGGHPGFFWPDYCDNNPDLFLNQDKRGFLGFSTPKDHIESSPVADQGCIDSSHKISFDLTNGMMPIDIHTFDNDAIVIENSQVNTVTLYNQNHQPYLTVEFDSPLVGIWSPPSERAPFICIEPWYGRADRIEYNGTFEEKDWMQHLAPGKQFEAHYCITIH